jgi:hypothetical protein
LLARGYSEVSYRSLPLISVLSSFSESLLGGEAVVDLIATAIAAM